MAKPAADKSSEARAKPFQILATANAIAHGQPEPHEISAGSEQGRCSSPVQTRRAVGGKRRQKKLCVDRINGHAGQGIYLPGKRVLQYTQEFGSVFFLQPGSR